MTTVAEPTIVVPPEVNDVVETTETGVPDSIPQKNEIPIQADWRMNLTLASSLKNQGAKNSYLDFCKSTQIAPLSTFKNILTNSIVDGGEYNLTTLSLANQSLGSKLLVPIVMTLNANPSTLTLLDLSGNHIGKSGGELIKMMIIHLKTLQSLELADNLLGEGVEFVVDATMEHPQMRYLGLRGMTTNHIVFQKIGNKLTDKEVELVVALLTKNHVLKRINLSDNCIDDTGAFQLAKLLGVNEFLKEVYLGWNHFGSRGACALMNSLKENPVLERFGLEWNGIGEPGSLILSQFLAKNNTIVYLNLRNTRLTDNAIITVAKGLDQNRQLQELILDNNPFSDIGSLAIYKAATSSDILQKLSLKGIRISVECRAKMDASKILIVITE